MITETDLKYLRRCVELAAEAVEKGDEPFGSLLLSQHGDVLAEDHNHVASGDHTRHPEFYLARWAAEHLTPDERSMATIYTSGEHCPMCAAAHGWVGLGRIVYASSSAQLFEWSGEWGLPVSRVKNLAIQEVIRDTPVDGPVPEMAEEIKALHEKHHHKKRLLADS